MDTKLNPKAIVDGCITKEKLSSEVQSSIEGKQDKLVSGTNIKTINGESIVGSGDIVMSAGAELSGKLNLIDVDAIKAAQSALQNTNQIAYYLITDSEGKIPSTQSCYDIPSDNVKQLSLTSPIASTNGILALATMSTTLNPVGVNVGDLIALTRVKVAVSDLTSALGISLTLTGEIEVYQYKILSTNDVKAPGTGSSSVGVMGLSSPWDKLQINKIPGIEQTANNALPKADRLPSKWESNMNNALETGVYPWCSLGRPANSTGHYTCIVNRTSTNDGNYDTIEQTAYGREGELGKIFKRIIFYKSDGTDTQYGEWKEITGGESGVLNVQNPDELPDDATVGTLAVNTLPYVRSFSDMASVIASGTYYGIRQTVDDFPTYQEVVDCIKSWRSGVDYNNTQGDALFVTILGYDPEPGDIYTDFYLEPILTGEEITDVKVYYIDGVILSDGTHEPFKGGASTTLYNPDTKEMEYPSSFLGYFKDPQILENNFVVNTTTFPNTDSNAKLLFLLFPGLLRNPIGDNKGISIFVKDYNTTWVDPIAAAVDSVTELINQESATRQSNDKNLDDLIYTRSKVIPTLSDGVIIGEILTGRSNTTKYLYAPYTYKSTGIDLSLLDIHGSSISRSTANCYVVRETGEYCFPLVYGNAIKNGATNTEAYTKVEGNFSHDFVNHLNNVITDPYIANNTGCVPTQAELSMADTDGVFKFIEVIDKDGTKYIRFLVNSIPSTGANGIISVLDADGVVMWSWHIWVWSDDLTPVTITNSTGVDYDILPFNLGSKWDTGKSNIKNWYYQFGRPTPMLCPDAAYNTITNHTNYGTKTFTKASIASDIGQGIQNPQTFYISSDSSYYYNWFSTDSSKTYNLWDAACVNTGNSDNKVVKTIYDPCPVGYHMPNGNTFTGFSKDAVINSFANGWYFKKNTSDTTGIFFPASGGRKSSDGILDKVGEQGYVWLSSAYNSNVAYYLIFHSSNTNAQYYNHRAYGFSVRPVKEEL